MGAADSFLHVAWRCILFEAKVLHVLVLQTLIVLQCLPLSAALTAVGITAADFVLANCLEDGDLVS